MTLEAPPSGKTDDQIMRHVCVITHPELNITQPGRHLDSLSHASNHSMGVQARLGSKAAAKDEESLPLTVDDDGDFKGHARRDRVRFWLRASTCAAILLYLVASTATFDFPWPRPDPAPLPGFIKDGLKQCETISRPPPSHRPATEKRTVSDRFVPGTKAVWLRNATVWTGGKGGEELLYSTDVLLDGGVIRKIGSSEDIRAVTKGDKEIEEHQLNGAWLTPGM